MGVDFFVIINEENKYSSKIHSILIVRTIKAVEGRNNKAFNKWVKIFEELTGKKFNKKEEYDKLD